MTTRTEKDSLGGIQVPSEALWGAQTQRARENFPISGTHLHRALVRAMVNIKLAAARTNRALEVLSPQRADAIERACGELLEGQFSDQFQVDSFQAGAGTSLHMNVNEVLANRANELLGTPRGSYAPVHPNDHVNLGQSTNDVFPTALRLAAFELSIPLAAALGRLADVLRDKAAELDGVVKSGRTHLADAAPIRLGQEIGAWSASLERHRSRLEQASAGLTEIGLGGSAVGTGLNCPPGYRQRVVEELALLLGHALRPAGDYFEAMQSMAPLVDLSGALRGLGLDLIRICNDIRLLGSGPATGLGELLLPAVQPGSSIMPGKVNPVMAEMLTMVCFDVIGRDAAVALAAQAGQLELNVMMPAVANALLPAEDYLTQALAAFTDRCAAGLQADANRCATYARRSPQLVTALVPRLGYARAAEVAKKAMASGLTIGEVAVSEGLLTGAEAQRLLDPRPLTEPEVRE